jgi:hypothetical protein
MAGGDYALFTARSRVLYEPLRRASYGRLMPLLVTRLTHALDPRRGRTLGPCVACGDAVRDRDDFVRAPRGGYSHAECATYRMRSRMRSRRRPAPAPHYTGD